MATISDLEVWQGTVENEHSTVHFVFFPAPMTLSHSKETVKNLVCAIRHNHNKKMGGGVSLSDRAG